MLGTEARPLIHASFGVHFVGNLWFHPTDRMIQLLLRSLRELMSVSKIKISHTRCSFKQGRQPILSTYSVRSWGGITMEGVNPGGGRTFFWGGTGQVAGTKEAGPWSRMPGTSLACWMYRSDCLSAAWPSEVVSQLLFTWPWNVFLNACW